LLRGPLESATKLVGDKPGEWVCFPWKSTEPGRLSGPLGHGPTTFLALRTLHDISHAIAPGASEPEAPPTVRTRPEIPLPPPTEPKDK
jgi:hypothetical protein